MIRRRCYHAWVLALLLPHSLLAQQPAGGEKPADKEQIEAALKLTSEAAAKYEMRLDEPGSKPAQLIAEPILRWSNPAVGEVHGNVFLWTIRSRPVAVGSLFKWFSPHTHSSHEFQSLTEAKLIADYSGARVWTASEPGVKYVRLEADAPADAATRRLVQLRTLAKRFSGELTTREGEQHELRLLPQPIYRYESTAEGVLDGGLFAFVQGTDPDILLLIEARGAPPQWHFAAARLQNCALAIKLDGRNAWSAPQLEWNVAFDHSQPYTLFDTPGK